MKRPLPYIHPFHLSQATGDWPASGAKRQMKPVRTPLPRRRRALEALLFLVVAPLVVWGALVALP